jgi:predicted DNA-binding antitoxin AbrB/MazE fold protein
MYFISMYENGTMKPVETVLRSRELDEGEWWRR